MSENVPSILIVDDEKDFRDKLAKYLSSQYPIYTAANGREAYSRVIENSDIQVILSDIHMPEMDGIELLEKITAHYDYIQTILMTGSSTESIAVDAIRKGAHDYFVKPVDLMKLDVSIKSAIEALRHKRNH